MILRYTTGVLGGYVVPLVEPVMPKPLNLYTITLDSFRDNYATQWPLLRALLRHYTELTDVPQEPPSDEEWERYTQLVWSAVEYCRVSAPERLRAFEDVTTALCPQCHAWALGQDEVQEVFGFRRRGKKRVPQSWCKACKKEDRRARRAEVQAAATST